MNCVLAGFGMLPLSVCTFAGLLIGGSTCFVVEDWGLANLLSMCKFLEMEVIQV